MPTVEYELSAHEMGITFDSNGAVNAARITSKVVVNGVERDYPSLDPGREQIEAALREYQSESL